MASLPPPSPDRNNPKPWRPKDSDADPSKFKRVADSSRPTGGPFGPGSKKKRDDAAKKWGGSKFVAKPKFGAQDRPRSENRDAFSTRPAFSGGRPSFERANPPAGGQNFGKVGSAHRNAEAPGFRKTALPSASTPTDWGEVAEWYDNLVGDEGSEYHQKVVLPGTLRLLGDVTGKRILDVACGQGVLCRQLVAKGAEMTGTDAATELLDVARNRGPESIRYQRSDATSLDGFEDATFDAATCLLAIQNIQSPQQVFAAASRVLKPGGQLLIVMMHPAFRSPKATRWGWDNDVQYRRVDRYLLPRKEPITTHPGQAANGGDTHYTWTFHRPLGDYVKYLRGASLLVDALEEWPSHKHSDSGPRAPSENAARKEIPMFLALRAVKSASAGA